MTATLDHRDHLALLRDEVARFQAAIGDLDLEVPACPGWRVRDLVRHVGSAQRMFRRVADEGWTTRPKLLPDDDRPDAEDDGVVEWAAREAARLLVALERLDPDAPRWNFTRGPQVGAFIPRRMLHETTVHRWDLEQANGARGSIRDDVAVDGVREVLEVLTLRHDPWDADAVTIRTVVDEQLVLDLTFAPGKEHRTVVATPEAVSGARAGTGPGPGTGAAATGRVTPDLEVPGLAATGAAVPDVVVTGRAPELLLAWWGRRPLETHLVSGDPRLLARIVDHVRT